MTRKPEAESGWQDTVVEYLRIHRYRVAHFRPARNGAGGWRTAVAYDGKGFPDIVAARDGLTLVAECKTNSGKLTRDQAEWLLVLGGMVWRPSDWLTIRLVIEGNSDARWELTERTRAEVWRVLGGREMAGAR